MYSFLTLRQRVLLLVPAILCSIIAGGVAPFMAHVVGKVFDAFAKFPASDPRLLQSISLSCLQLVGLGCASLALSSITSVLWITTAELNLLALRKAVYHAVLSSPRPSNPAAQMSKFAKETDDIRAATSLAPCFIIQHLTTTIAALILAFLRSYSLTLVILSSLPLLILIQSLSQSFAAPLIIQERSHSSHASSTIDTALSSIDTVKAFNAQHLELTRSMSSLTALQHTALRLSRLWGLTSGSAQFVMMAMFVQAFWYGAKLVRDAKNSPGDIMAVFWACLVATSNLQMCIPRWIVYAKGKFAFTDLMSIIHAPSPSPSPAPSSSSSPSDPPLSPTSKRSRTLRKISPSRCIGELALHNVTFSYNTNNTNSNDSTKKTLDSLSLFLPANELTFLIGSSGSGKSTIAQLLLGFQTPGNGGHVTIDEQDLRFLDEEWIRENVMLIGQGIGVGVGAGGDASSEDNNNGGGGGGDYGTCILFSQKSIFENVALALSEDTKSVPYARVVEACRAAMLHEFVIDLPEGYDTVLGSGDGGNDGGGIQLSGGQKQRLMLARARLRNPPILILDEATSALDPPTRVLVLSALRRWRSNKTTIVITHDIAQIEQQDFVYVLKDGKVVEQGFRGDLEVEEKEGGGEFRLMMMVGRGGPSVVEPKVVEDKEKEVEEEEKEEEERGVPPLLKHQSLALRPLTFGNWNWMFDAVAELTRPSPHAAVPAIPPNSDIIPVPELAYLPPGMQKQKKRETLMSRLVMPFQTQPQTQAQTRPTLPRLEVQQLRRPSSAMMTPLTTVVVVDSAVTAVTAAEGCLVMTPMSSKSRRFSAPTGGAAFMETTPTSATFTVVDRDWDWDVKGGGGGYDEDEDEDLWREEEEEFEKEKKAIEKSGDVVHEKRRKMSRGNNNMNIKVVGDENGSPSITNPTNPTTTPTTPPPSFWRTTLLTLPTIPCKPLFGFALFLCALSGLMTPLFSFFLSRLLFEVSQGGTNTHAINRFGGGLLVICALDGVLMGGKYFVMEVVSMRWVTRVRECALGRVLAQDRAWFDGYSSSKQEEEEETPHAHAHTTQSVVQTLIKDGDDARALISVVYGQTFVVLTMLGTGLIWALVLGWQLTLAGLAIAPIFAATMAVQSRFSSLSESRNKAAKEGVSKAYYDSLKHVFAVRALGGSGFRKEYERRFERSVDRVRSVGVGGAFVEGSGFGVSSGMIYFAEAGLFYVGAVLMGRGVFGYLRMVEVLNLVVFSVSIGAQLMAFTEKIAKSTQATASLLALSSLPTTHTSESKGTAKPTDLARAIEFNNVSFSYPSRPTQPVLKEFNLRIEPGEVVAIVGGSGCGKSTVVGLLQRLWEPSSGGIYLEDEKKQSLGLGEVDVRWLRSRMAVVSQSPTLFDTSVGENIRYGSSVDSVSDRDVREAAKRANVHEVVMGLGEGYDSVLGREGEGGGGLSGGQAQRVQIARGLARKDADLIILDEGTSALDGENERVVLDGVLRGKGKKTTVVMVTHKLEVMRVCDRIVVLGRGGRVVEEGRFEELVERRGEFARLASGGLWES